MYNNKAYLYDFKNTVVDSIESMEIDLMIELVDDADCVASHSAIDKYSIQESISMFISTPIELYNLGIDS